MDNFAKGQFDPAAHQPSKAELEEKVSAGAPLKALAWAITHGGAERRDDKDIMRIRINGAPAGIRTRNRFLSGEVLYPLSYGRSIGAVGVGDRIRTGVESRAKEVPNRSATPTSTDCVRYGLKMAGEGVLVFGRPRVPSKL